MAAALWDWQFNGKVERAPRWRGGCVNNMGVRGLRGLRGLWSGVWGVYGSIFSWRFQWDHRQPCLTSAAGDIADLVKSSFAGPQGPLIRMCEGCLWMHLFMPFSMTPSAAMSDLGGRRYHHFLMVASSWFCIVIDRPIYTVHSNQICWLSFKFKRRA